MLFPDPAPDGRSLAFRRSVGSRRPRLSSNRSREYSCLLKVAENLTFEQHPIDYDWTDRYNPLTDTEFPFFIRLLNYRRDDFTAAVTCHEHSELWIPIDSEAQFRLGDRWANLNPG